MKLAEEAETHLDSAEQIAWFNQLEADHDNLRAALRWSIESGAVTEGSRLAGALYYFWYVRGYIGEGRECLNALLTRPEAATRTAVRAKALNAAVGLLQWGQRNHVAALPLLEESLSIGQEVGDKLNIARSLRLMGIVAFDQGQYATARSFAEEALALLRALEYKPGIARILYFLGDVALQQGNSEEAQALYEESLSLFQMLDEKNQLAYILRRLGLVACYQRDWPAAVMRLHESIKLNQAVGSPGGVAACLTTLAAVSVAIGQTAHAAQLLGAVEALTVSNHVQLMASDQDQFDRTVNTVHAKLSEAASAKAWAEGQGMTLEQAIEEAMRIGYRLQPAQPAVLIEPLNEREREMLQLIADGLTNHEIAERLVIALSTVKWHVSNLFGKLGVSSRTQAIARAKELGLL